jgi:hypothetical protein
METQNFIKYEEARGIMYLGELRTIKKKADSQLQFLYEAFMNSWEAIVEKYTSNHINKGKISIKLFLKGNLLSDRNNVYDFEKFEIEDNGIGLNEKNYSRLLTLRDDSKKMSNKGTGRIQYIHFFDVTKIKSTYKSKDTSYKEIEVTLSKKEAFLKNNAIIRLDKEVDSVLSDSGCRVTFINPLDKKDLSYFSSLSAEAIKTDFIKHFLSLFCENRAMLPQINVIVYHDEEEFKKLQVLEGDISKPDKEESLEIAYSKLDERNKIVKSEKTETFQLKAFKLSSSELKNNGIYLVSKGSTGKTIDIDTLKKDDEINGKRYMFLLSGQYLDDRDQDDRGNIRLIESKEFRSQNEGNLFAEEEILFESVKEEANERINSLYNELESKNQEKNKNIDELREMFLLNSKTVESIRKKIRNTDSDEKILKVIYEADSEIEAEKDNQIKEQLEALKKITPDKTENYQKELQKMVDEFVKLIPLQNRTTLSRYVARRKLVLDLFGQILNKELEEVRSNKKGRIDEKLLHNLIFQQSSESECPEDSDLWLINEEYIYFKGFSESKLDDVKIGDDYLFKRESDMEEEEKEYKYKNNKDAGERRPDVLLFPKEGKCIIIEFKAPDVDVSNHLNQINRYARLINNLSSNKIIINTYYGYLIGESIDIDEVQDADSDFISSANLNYIYRPYKKITGKFGRENGALYTEIIKYSTLLERAQLRNQIFIDKLTKMK